MDLNQEKVETQSNESYMSYYIFVFISAIIGFAAVLFVAGAAIDRFTNSEGLSFLYNNKFTTAMLVALVLTILFVIISIVFKKQLKNIFLSEIFLYLYIGTLTTAVNIIAFEALRNVLARSGGESGAGWKIAEILAFVIAVIFAFVADKLVVFRSYNLNPMKIFSEAGMFFGARLITEVINFTIMWFMIDVNKINPTITKLIASVVVIVLNYVFSKYIIFKKNAKEA